MTAAESVPPAAASSPEAAGGAPRSWTLTFPAGMELLNANGRHHWRVRQRVTKDLRWTSYVLTRQARVPHLARARFDGVYEPPDRRRRESQNLYPTFKALIDGVVDAGVLDDDSDRYVTALEMRAGDQVHPGGRVLLHITEIPEVA